VIVFAGPGPRLLAAFGLSRSVPQPAAAAESPVQERAAAALRSGGSSGVSAHVVNVVGQGEERLKGSFEMACPAASRFIPAYAAP
jgi:hypothetical protein